MKLTSEQQSIINSTGNIRVNAVAGSGKTTTMVHYAATRPSGARILYLAFNRSVKLEARKRFLEKGLPQVQVETAHSLAYRPVVVTNGYEVRQSDYRTSEVAELLGLKAGGERHGELILANHILKFINYFCNSDAARVQQLDYLNIITDDKAIIYAKRHYQQIEDGARAFLAKMYHGEIPVTHDFYLKRYQLLQPVLNYDYILFDEGQDASPAMLDIFLKQKGTKVIVGDANQQVYSWRHAVNSLEKADFASYQLTESFRFNQEIAKLSGAVLKWKSLLTDWKRVTITGKGKPSAGSSRATIARTNLALLLKAITYIKEHGKVKGIYFEGNINSYTYADEGASLYDVLNLYNNEHHSIRDKLVASMKDLDELETYIENTGDQQLSMMVEIVKEYGNEIPGLIRLLKDKHVSDEEKGTAGMIFSTVHRAKGMEYDSVVLADDFITEARIERLAAAQKNGEVMGLEKLLEEINLLYVAITRTRGMVSIPEAMMPSGAGPSAQVHVIQTKYLSAEGGREKVSIEKAGAGNSSSYAETRLAQKNRVRDWTAENDEALKKQFHNGIRLADIARHFGRPAGAIISRLKQLGSLE